MLRALQRLLATRAAPFAAVVGLAILVAALAWWPEAEAPAVADGPAPAPRAPAPTSPPSDQATPPPVDAEMGGAAEPERPPVSRSSGQARALPGSSGLSVRSILVGADRRLALVDGRIVGTGDRVGGAVVVAIRARAVEVREAGGGRRTLELTRPAPGVELR